MVFSINKQKLPLWLSNLEHTSVLIQMSTPSSQAHMWKCESLGSLEIGNEIYGNSMAYRIFPEMGRLTY